MSTDDKHKEEMLELVMKDCRRVVSNCYKRAARDVCHPRDEHWLAEIVETGHGDPIDIALPYVEFKKVYLTATENMIQKVAQAMLLNPLTDLEIKVVGNTRNGTVSHCWILRALTKHWAPEKFVFLAPPPPAEKPPIAFSAGSTLLAVDPPDDFMQIL